jgi:hypothetical protein
MCHINMYSAQCNNFELGIDKLNIWCVLYQTLMEITENRIYETVEMEFYCKVCECNGCDNKKERDNQISMNSYQS